MVVYGVKAAVHHHADGGVWPETRRTPTNIIHYGGVWRETRRTPPTNGWCMARNSPYTTTSIFVDCVEFTVHDMPIVNNVRAFDVIYDC